MKRNLWLLLALSVVIMIGFPWLAVTFAPRDAGMIVAIVLFYIAYPLYFIGLGIYAGKNAGKLWFVPLACSIFFLLGAWIFFQIGEMVFIYQALIYLVISLAAMAITRAIYGKLRN